MDPFPFLAAGANVANSMFGAFTAANQQKRANQFNIDMWQRMNEYNSPQAQMARLKNAGLNPNLIYGQGASGASGNTSNAPTFEKLAEPGYSPLDIPSALGSLQSFTDWDIKKATKDNLVAKTETERQNLLLKTADTAGKILKNSKSAIELPFAERMAKTSLQALEANVKKTLADTRFTENQDIRSELKNNQDILESAQRILASKSGIKLNDVQMQKIMTDTRVQRFFADLADAGINPNLRPEITELGSALAKIMEMVMNGVKDFDFKFW